MIMYKGYGLNFWDLNFLWGKYGQNELWGIKYKCDLIFIKHSVHRVGD